MSTPTSSSTSQSTGLHLIAHAAEYLLFGVLVLGALTMLLIVGVIAVRRVMRRH